jgi:hypothetical protein
VIGLFNFATHEFTLHLAVCDFIEREKQHSRRLAIEAMNGVDSLPELIAQELYGENIGVAGDR